MNLLVDLKEKIDARSAEQAFNQAMVAAQSELRPIVKDAWNTQTSSPYAKLETIDKAINPILRKYGFAFTFSSPEVQESGKVTVSCKLLHEGGHAEPYRLTAGLDNLGIKGSVNKTEMHGLASSITYLRRYLKVMAFDLTLIGQDKDGNSEPPALTDDQLIQLRDRLERCAMDEKALAQFLGILSVDSVEAIRSHNFVIAMNLLQAKLRLKGVR